METKFKANSERAEALIMKKRGPQKAGSLISRVFSLLVKAVREIIQVDVDSSVGYLRERR